MMDKFCQMHTPCITSNNSQNHKEELIFSKIQLTQHSCFEEYKTFGEKGTFLLSFNYF